MNFPDLNCRRSFHYSPSRRNVSRIPLSSRLSHSALFAIRFLAAVLTRLACSCVAKQSTCHRPLVQRQTLAIRLFLKRVKWRVEQSRWSVQNELASRFSTRFRRCLSSTFRRQIQGWLPRSEQATKRVERLFAPCSEERKV